MTNKEGCIEGNVIECPFGGDETNDCADCVCSCDYHFVNGECVLRESGKLYFF